MSAPFLGTSLEERLNHINALLRLAAHAADTDDLDVRDGAEICVHYALEVLREIQSALPADVLGVTAKRGGTQ